MYRTVSNSRATSPSGARSAPALAAVLAVAIALIGGCGGGGSGSAPAAGTTTITGSVFAAPVSGSALTVRDTSGTIVAGPVATAADGTFGIAVPTAALSGGLRFEAVGGGFVDEATGRAATAGRLAAYAEAGTLGAGSAVHLTPFSTVVDGLVAGGRTLAAANAAFSAGLGFADNTQVAPRNDNAATGPDNVAMRLAGLRAVAFSRLTNDLGIVADNQFRLADAIARDLSDNTLNGRDAAGAVEISPGIPLPEDIQNRYESAVDAVFDNASVNHTGLTADKIGTLPFAKLALTNSYRVEYLPGAALPAQGKTQFGIRVTRRSDNTAVTGLAASGSLTVLPWMHMATRSHSSPWDNAIADNGDGTYSVTVYYLMSTAMNGISMGYWHIGFLIGGTETATFYPAVAMAMGTDTVRATLKGQLDNIAAAPATEQRTYYLFKDGGMTYDNTSTSHTLNLFLAAKESMESFPAIAAGTVLHDAAGTPWTVTMATVEASTDNTTWLPGTNTAGGHWSVPGLTGLARGSAATVSVRVAVNGERKTTNGGAPAGANEYATFAVTAP